MKVNFPFVTVLLFFAAFPAGCSTIVLEKRHGTGLKEQAASVKKRSEAAIKRPLISERREAEVFFEANQSELTAGPDQGRKGRQKAQEPSALKESVSEAGLPPKLALEAPGAPGGSLPNIMFRGLKTGVYLFTWSGLIKDEEELR